MDKNSLRVMHSSERHDWPTPREFFGACERLCVEATGRGFDIDAAADADNTKASRFFSESDDGLSQQWTGNVWCNPPYGEQAGRWVRKAFEETDGFEDQRYVAVLIPARTGTRWFHDWAAKAAEIRFVKGRIRFEGAEASAPFDSVLLVFNEHQKITSGQRVIFWDPYARNLDLFEDARVETWIQGLESTTG